MKTIKLRTAKGEMSQRFSFGDGADDLHEWISNKIPPMPKGQMCEDHRNNAVNYYTTEKEIEAPAEDGFYTWRIEGDHVCYTYLCANCYNSMDLDVGTDPEDYPTTKAGYAIAPKHCS